MMDVSDGLLVDAARMAEASGVGVTVDLARLPLSVPFRAIAGDSRERRLFAATAGDDYVLLFTAPAANEPALLAEADRLGQALVRIGEVVEGSGINLRDGGETVPLPAKLGYQH